MQQLLKIRHWQWSAKEVTLIRHATLRGKAIALGLRFYAFGYYRQTKALGQGHDGAGNSRIVVIGQQVADKGLVNFELIQRQAFQVGE